MQTMSQSQNTMREETTITRQEAEDWVEAGYFYAIYTFEEFLKSKRFGHTIWQDLSTEAKAIIRRQVALEQVQAEGHL